MKDFLLIENDNNLDIVNHDFAFTSSVSQYAAQKVRILLSIFKGEHYLDVNEGLPYFESILIKNPDINFIEDLYKVEILSIPEIQELTKFDMDIGSDRKLTIDWAAITIDNESISETFTI